MSMGVIGNYFVKEECGKWKIMKDEGWYVTDASLNNPWLMWNGIEPFESKIQAYTWLKKHVNELL